jgi:hypothetical protein
MLQELHRFDVRYAFAHFIERFGLEFGVLMVPAHPDHRAQRAYLEAVVGFLVEVEEIGRGSSLPPGPLYDALAYSIEKAEVLLEAYRRVISVERSINRH